MKFLLHGNSPTVKTGYGIQIGQLAEQLKADGHQPACSSTYGLQMSIEQWRGIRVYGCGYDVNSNDRLHFHARHWFDGDHTNGWLITCVDVWALHNPVLAQMNVAAWVPVDHYPLQPNVREFFVESGAIPVAMSRFGEKALAERGLDPVYIPLSVDTRVYRPVADIEGMTPRQAMSLYTGWEVPDDGFVVGMVAMNKGWARDRKGFHEAFRAFGFFCRTHPDAYLYVHADKWGSAEGINLQTLAIECGIPEHKLLWAGGADDQYPYYVGYPPELMAAMYSAMDVLLAPSHGEGFCVPLVEAQACGTPVIATNFSAQAELVHAGWKVRGTPEWDPAHHSNYLSPAIATDIPPAVLGQMIDDIGEETEIGFLIRVREFLHAIRDESGLGVLDALDEAYEARQNADEWEKLRWSGVQFAQDYDTQRVYDMYWRPFIASLEGNEKLDLVREPMPAERAVAVLCPVLNRPQNIAPLVESFRQTTDPDEATLYFVAEDDDRAELDALRLEGYTPLTSPARSFAEKLNVGFANTKEPWVLVVGDDVRFHDGWLEQARKLSGEFDVIGTNDTAGAPKNVKVANGSHADHFFVRRSYVDEYGACLDGPGVLAPEAYRHWFTDMEIVKLAKARGVFSPCLDSVVEHLHPGYDGDEAARQADPTYMTAVHHQEADERTWRERLPLIEMHRTSRAKL